MLSLKLKVAFIPAYSKGLVWEEYNSDSGTLISSSWIEHDISSIEVEVLDPVGLLVCVTGH
jgi:hypothetical protein